VLEPRKLRFIDHLVADSRDVALNHTAGRSPPHQAMLFSPVELADTDHAYRRACIAILRRRVTALLGGLGLEAKPGPLFDNYYGLIDLEFWLRKYLGDEVAEFIKRTVHPLDIVFRLARDYGIVLLNGGGSHAPDWSVGYRSPTWTTPSMPKSAVPCAPSRRTMSKHSAPRTRLAVPRPWRKTAGQSRRWSDGRVAVQAWMAGTRPAMAWRSPPPSIAGRLTDTAFCHRQRCLARHAA